MITTVRLEMPAETARKILGEEIVQPLHEADVMAISLGTAMTNCPAGVLPGRPRMRVMEIVALFMYDDGVRI